MLAMSLSAIARIPCLLITPSVLLNKYFGETNQRCRTLFSLASKLSPCIICIDELDGLFRKRNDNEHEASRDLKAEFLQHWEGMSSQKVRNLVIGATNRPFDVDEAVLRRFTQSYLVGLPDKTDRCSILARMLQDIPTEDDALALATRLSERTENYSPSDLRRLLQAAAALGPLRDSPNNPRPLTTIDIERALQGVSATPLSPDYRHSLASFIQSNKQFSPAAADVPHHDEVNSHSQQALLWETDLGNFYHLGSLPMDTASFDLLTNVLKRLSDVRDDMSEWSNEEEDDFQDEDTDE
jgi:SpoVK/Ycf46/Vps4 family AAA+-type ATPase